MFYGRCLCFRGISTACVKFMAIDPYGAVLKKLKGRGIRFVIIGVSGINYYADDPGEMYSTQDLDVLVRPDGKSVLAALGILEKEGFRIESNGEPLVGIDAFLVSRIIERRAVVTARKGRDVRIDIVLDAGGFSFKEWESNRCLFKVGRVLIAVGSLSRLIKAKENSGRDKDVKFLALYKTQLEDMLRRAKQRRTHAEQGGDA